MSHNQNVVNLRYRLLRLKVKKTILCNPRADSEQMNTHATFQQLEVFNIQAKGINTTWLIGIDLLEMNSNTILLAHVSHDFKQSYNYNRCSADSVKFFSERVFQ